MLLRNWWKDLAVAKKLYTVVGIMGLLIATELFTLNFAMNTLSAVRAFVGGEGLWSKAQKSASHNLYKYALSREEADYQNFLTDSQVILGDRKARLELEKQQPDVDKITAGFTEGKISPQDIPGMVRLIVRFHKVPHLAKAIGYWRGADVKMQEVLDFGKELHERIANSKQKNFALQESLRKIDALNGELTVLENNFSYTLGEGSHWLEQLLMKILIALVLTVESAGLLLTSLFSRSLSRSLREIVNVAQKVGQGDFTQRVPMRSKDELGQMADVLNKMTFELQENVGGRKHAEDANRVKSLFLASMSHEIRTPLSAILGFTDLLKDQNLAPTEHDKYIAIIERTAKTLSQIINDVLDLSKVEAGHLEVKLKHFQLPELLSQIYSLLNLKCVEKGIILEFIPKGEIPQSIYTDPLRLQQILTNMVSNAIKFTDSGKISLTYNTLSGQLYFKLQDSGVGIPLEQQHLLFKPFSQADNLSNNKNVGTGLGLVLSRSLARLLGGDVVLTNSEVNRGSLFLITMKYEQGQESSARSSASTLNSQGRELEGKSVLFVEDTEENQILVQLILTKRGARVSLANNGLEGIHKALHEDFDIVLMDMRMPVMDGYQATQALREQGYKKPIVALTAHAMKEDYTKCIQVGCNDYITKPINTHELISAILRSFDT